MLCDFSMPISCALCCSPFAQFVYCDLCHTLDCMFVCLLKASVFIVTNPSLYCSEKFHLLPLLCILCGGALTLLTLSMPWVSFPYVILCIDCGPGRTVLSCRQRSIHLQSTHQTVCLPLLTHSPSMACVTGFHHHNC
jgi:hypothetical protein